MSRSVEVSRALIVTYLSATDPPTSDMNGPGGFIKQQYRGILEQGARNSHTLLLSSAESDATFADLGLVGFGERHDAVMHLRGLGRFLNFTLGSPKLAVATVPVISTKFEGRRIREGTYPML